MAKQRYYTDPATKLMEAYANFSGGMNSVTADEQMEDKELRLLKNGDISDRGTIQKRKGHQLVSTPATFTTETPVVGWIDYTTPGDVDLIVSVKDSKVYANNTVIHTFTTPLTRTVDIVEFRRILYFATEQGLHSYDGTTFKKVEAKKPSALEYLYVGANALADAPEYWVASENASIATNLDGAVVQPRYGTAGKDTSFMPIFRVPNVADEVKFRLEYLLPSDPSSQTWRLYKEYTKAEATADKGMAFRPTEVGNYKFRVLMRNLSAPPIEGDTRTEEEKWQQDSFQFQVPNYEVRTSVDPKDIATDSSAGIHTCNRARVYKNRLYLWGSTHTEDALYISFTNDASYFPQTQIIQFENRKNEPLRNVVEFRDSLIIFTDSTIQTLFGNDADTWRRVILNTDIGCPFPFGSTVIKNYVAFVSKENVYVLKSLYSAPEQMNVQKVDAAIQNMLPERLNEHTTLVDLDGSKLIVSFPDIGEALRWDYDLNAWAWDTSWIMPRRPVVRAYNVLDMAPDGRLIRFYTSGYQDVDTFIEFEFQTKQFTFGEPFIIKKLRQLQVQMAQGVGKYEVFLTVFADEEPTISPSAKGYAIENDTVRWVQEYLPNMTGYGGTIFGDWVVGKSPFGDTNIVTHKIPASGKCRRVSIHMKTINQYPFKLYRMGFIYKAKKP